MSDYKDEIFKYSIRVKFNTDEFEYHEYKIESFEGGILYRVRFTLNDHQIKKAIGVKEEKFKILARDYSLKELLNDDDSKNKERPKGTIQIY